MTGIALVMKVLDLFQDSEAIKGGIVDINWEFKKDIDLTKDNMDLQRVKEDDKKAVTFPIYTK
ncbi:hypothetical protein A6R68_16858, partial [Neotoma lepida]